MRQVRYRIIILAIIIYMSDEDIIPGGRGEEPVVATATLASLEKMTGIVTSMTEQLRTVNQAIER